jgi:peptidoglycan hydrolase CwlO-like protein
MKKRFGLGVMLLAGLLVIPGNLWLAGQVFAQEGSKQLTDKEYQELQKKRQEQWNDLERMQHRQDNTGQRLQEAGKRRQDAEKRQKAAEKRLRELEK